MAKKKTTKKRATKKKASSRKPKTPQRRSCAHMQVYDRLCDEDYGFRERHAKIDEAADRHVSTGRFAAAVRPVRVIPCVVHVLHRTAREKISKSQINSQFTALNRDFRAKNADKSKVPDIWKGLIGDARVEFELAKKDPNGKPTNGVIYKETTERSFGTNDEAKSATTGGSKPWNTSKYLNLWVCTLRGGLLGYAQFPGGPKSTDGVVILNTAFGTSGTASAPFNKGRTTTHEVGHFFNLRHIWGDVNGCGGTDFVADTPDARMPNTGKPAFPHITCRNGPHGDMFMDYMDYVDDDSMMMFSIGQVARMEAAITGPRKSLGHNKPKPKPRYTRKKKK